MYVARDIMCSGYVAGANTRFFGAPKNGSFPVAPASKDDVTNAMDARLSFQNDAEGEYDSMLAFCAPYGDGAKRDQVISITDRLLPWEVTRAGGTKDYFPGGDANYRAVSNVLGLNTIHFGEDVRAAENMEFISQGKLLGCHAKHCNATVRHCCLELTHFFARRFHEQRPLLRRPAPQVQPLQQPVPRARSGPGPLRTR